MLLAAPARRGHRWGCGAEGPGARRGGCVWAGSKPCLPAPAKGSMAGGTLSQSMQIAC